MYTLLMIVCMMGATMTLGVAGNWPMAGFLAVAWWSAKQTDKHQADMDYFFGVVFMLGLLGVLAAIVKRFFF